MPVPLVLASASPARLATLRAAGIEPTVIVSRVDEEALHPRRPGRGRGRRRPPPGAREGRGRRRPRGAGRARARMRLDPGARRRHARQARRRRHGRGRWRAMRGREGILHTGHWLIDARASAARGAAPSARRRRPRVWFADLIGRGDRRVRRHRASRSPSPARSRWTASGVRSWSESTGDHHNVVGLSLPLLRRLCATSASAPGAVGAALICWVATTYAAVTTP